MDIKNSDNNNEKKINPSFGIKIFLSVFILFIFSIVAILVIKFDRVNPDFPIFPISTAQPSTTNISEIKKFSSEQEFKDYLEESSHLASGYGGGIMRSQIANGPISAPNWSEKIAIDGTAPVRISDTNVQVTGIDEPDIVKTDGKEIYFSNTQRFYYPMMREAIPGSMAPNDPGITFEEQQRISPDSKIMMPPIQPQEKTSIIKGFPPANLALEGTINKQGDLLLDKNNLIIFSNLNYSGSGQEINGYDISNPRSPNKTWTIKLDINTSVVTSRLYEGKIYLVTKNNISSSRPCPLKPMIVDGAELNIKCTDIYHPILPMLVDSTFIAMVLDPSSGKIENTISFIGSSGFSTIYISKNAIYTAYAYNESIAKFFSGFIKENDDIFPSSFTEKVINLEGYDISESSKLQEIMALIEKYNNSLSSDERMKMENELTNRMSTYYKAHRRDLEKTGIIKIGLDDFRITASGAVPGHLLNNFSMDEYDGNLRVASTISSTGGFIGGMNSGESVSDVTILDSNLKTIGSIQDLGKTEQIYSIRFIEDKGYMVTFRQTDPFYILDLKNPKNPEATGELKIPGYSSYLHPLDTTHILGVGMESGKVKISLFDVSDKNNPIELDRYLLDEYWSEVSNNYHAFLLDTKHNIFFLPGSKGGYVFSYGETFAHPGICKQGENCSNITDYKLELKKAVSQNSVKRAIYLNDYLYIIGDDKITVLNELDWEKVNEMDLNK